MIRLCAIMLLLTTAAGSLKAQIVNDPTHWAYGLKKLGGSVYELHLRVTIDSGWHIYAQRQLPDAVAVPTKINFEKTAGLTFVGKTRELGKKETYTIKEAGVTNYEYSGKVDFVQKVMLKPNVKLIKGTITYQTCTHQMCLAEKTISFSVRVP